MGPTLLDMSKVIKPGEYMEPFGKNRFSCLTESHPVHIKHFRLTGNGTKVYWDCGWFLLRDGEEARYVFRDDTRETLGSLNTDFCREKRIGVPCSDEQIIDSTVLFTFIPDWTPFFMKSYAEDIGTWVLVRFGDVSFFDGRGVYPKVCDISDDCFAGCRFYYGPNMDPWDDEDSEEDTKESPIEKDDKYLISWDISNKKEKGVD